MESITLNQIVPQSFKEAEILDVEGNKHQMEKFWSSKPVLFVFIRHFGCFGCTLQMQSIGPRLEELEKLGVRTILVGNGNRNFIDGFIERHMLAGRPVEIYTDPSLNVYKQANLVRSFWMAFGPVGLWEMLSALVKGIGQKRIEGDNGQMGGAMLVDEAGKVHYYFRNKTIAKHSNPNDIMDALYKFIGKRSKNNS